MNPLGWMLTETVDGVCLPGMMSADLAITQQGRAALRDPRRCAPARSHGRSSRRGSPRARGDFPFAFIVDEPVAELELHRQHALRLWRLLRSRSGHSCR